jgi:hypothetical protein
MKYIKLKLKVVLPLLLLFALGGQALIPASALACGSSSGSSTSQVEYSVGSTTAGTAPDCSGSGVTNVLSAAVTVLSLVIGAAAVIMILVGGFKYMTSGGDSSKVASAKTTLIYALVGVAVAALAQFLVHFVLYQATNAPTPPAVTAPKKT